MSMAMVQGLGGLDVTAWSSANKTASRILSPLRGPIQAALDAAGVPKTESAKIVSAPLDFLLDLFDPIENAVGRAVDRVMAKKGATQTFFGTKINLTRVQAVDRKADASVQNLLRSLRTIQAFIVLLWTQPLELAGSMLQEGLDIASTVAQNVTKAGGDAAAAVSKAAGDVVKNVSNTVSAAGDAVKDFFGFDGLGDLGEPVTVATTAAATGLAATAGAALETAIAAVITSIVTALGTAGAMAVTNATTPKPAAPKVTAAPVSFRPTTTIIRTSTAPAQTATPLFVQKDNTMLYVGGAAALAGILFLATRK